MSKELHCADLGMRDCDWVAKGSTAGEILKQTVKHAEQVHGIANLNQALQKKVFAAIRTTS